MVSSTLGSPTKTCWKRRSRAASFSMCWRYSSSGRRADEAQLAAGEHRLEHVAGVHRALAGGAGTDDRVQLVDEGDDLAVGCLDLVEHGLEPLLELAAVLRPGEHGAEVERVEPLVPQASGTSPSTMRWASPSTTAVLPTPGSPMRTGLFLVRRDSTCTTRRISASRPMTGSSLPSRAAAVRSVPYFASASAVASGFSVVTVWPPRRPRDLRLDGLGVEVARTVTPPFSIRARSRTSVEEEGGPSPA